MIPTENPDAATEKRLSEIRDKIAAVLKEACDEEDMPVDQIVAVLAFMTGGAIAMLDQRVFSPDMAGELVHTNIQRGNEEAIRQVASAMPGKHGGS